MTRLSILGGTGMAGSALACEAASRGHSVTVASRHPNTVGPPHATGITTMSVDVTTGKGLADAVAGANVVIYAVNATSKPPRAMCDGLAATLSAVEKAGSSGAPGTPLVVLPSIIGCESLPGAYYMAKVEQERILRDWDGPSLTVRIAQFHQFVDMLLTAASSKRVSPRAPLPLQPVEVGAAARAMLDATDAGPSRDVRQIAGPEPLTLTAAARMHASARGYRAVPLRLPLLGMGAAKRGALTPDRHAVTLTGASFVSWLDAATREEVQA